MPVRKNRATKDLIFEVPEAMFRLFLAEGFVLRCKSPTKARVNPRLRCWRDTETEQMRFAVRNPKVDPHAIPSSWAMLMKAFLFKVQYTRDKGIVKAICSWQSELDLQIKRLRWEG
jgi:hypothetical protein